MLEIKVTVSAPELSEAINNLAKAYAGNPTATVQAVNPVQTETAVPAQTETAVPAQPTAPVTNSAPSVNTPPAPVVTTQPVQTVPTATSPAVQAPSEPAKTYTQEQLSNAGAALCEQGKMPQLIQLLSQFGAQSIVQVSKEQYTALAEGLKALGANL